MLLELTHRLPVPVDLDEASLREVEAFLAASDAPLGCSRGLALAVATSSLRASGRRPPRITSMGRPGEAECVRLLEKARILFEHCLERESSVCVIGFLEHRMSRGRDERGLVGDVLAWMTEQACASARPRNRLVDEMIDFGVSFLHGLDAEEARALREMRE